MSDTMSIHKVTRKGLAATVAARWKDAYGPYRNARTDSRWYSEMRTKSGLGSEAIHRRLCALGDTPDPQAVDEIIGNASWTTLSCDCCGRDVEEAVRLPAYEGPHPTTICAMCLGAAVTVLGGASS